MVTIKQWEGVPDSVKVRDRHGRLTTKVRCQCGVQLEYMKSWKRHAEQNNAACLAFFNVHVHGTKTALEQDREMLYQLYADVQEMKAIFKKLQLTKGSPLHKERERNQREMFLIDPPFSACHMTTYKKLLANQDERQIVHYAVRQAQLAAEAGPSADLIDTYWYSHYLRVWMDINEGCFYKVRTDNANNVIDFIIGDITVAPREVYRHVYHMIRRISTKWYQKMLKGEMIYDDVFLRHMMTTANTRLPSESYDGLWPSCDAYFDTTTINDMHEVPLEIFFREYYNDAVRDLRKELKASLALKTT